MEGGKTQGQGPDQGTDAVEDQVAHWRVAGQADGHRHHRAQAVDEAEAQHPDIRVAADVRQRAVAHGLPARLASEDLAALVAAQVIPELVAGIAAEEGGGHYIVDVHVAAEGEKAGQDQDRLALEEGAEEEGEVAEILEKLLQHGWVAQRNERAA
ncbi:hypothetical protein D3C76_1274710 [compost metagenome]